MSSSFAFEMASIQQEVESPAFRTRRFGARALRTFRSLTPAPAWPRPSTPAPTRPPRPQPARPRGRHAADRTPGRRYPRPHDAPPAFPVR
ncbi:hypothetical protein GA0115251_13884 [Streptomyces sp. TverLS-915]|nr:hypothetical protein GA0115251_13884 [Streptomyces sp. TverLS-915]